MNQLDQHPILQQNLNLYPRRLNTDHVQKKASFMSQAITPSQKAKQKFVDFQDIPQSQHLKDGPNSGMVTSSNNLGGANIIVNINGTTNINNFHNFTRSQQANIRGRKIDMPQLRLGQEIDESGDQLNPAMQAQMTQTKGTSKTVQKKQTMNSVVGGIAHQPMKSAKHQRVTHKGLMQQTLKQTNKHNEGMKQFLQQTLNMTSAIHQQGKQKSSALGSQTANSQLKLNPSQTQKLNLRERKSVGSKNNQQQHFFPNKFQQNFSSNNVTIETGNMAKQGMQSGNVAKQQRPTTAVNVNKQGTDKSGRQREVKSSRTLTQAKQQNLTRHKRNKSEARKYNTGAAVGMTASRSGNQSVQTGQKKVNPSKKMTIKTERQLNIDRRKSAEQPTQPNSWITTVTNAQAPMSNTNNNIMKVDAEGLSMSSISSGDKLMDSSMRAGGKNRHNISIQQHLSKNYFLNSKQLLRHLSPARLNNQQIGFGPNQAPQLEIQSSMEAQRAPPNSQCAIQKGSSSIGLTTRQPRQKRNRSTSNAASKTRWQTTANQSNSRKAQSLSNSRESQNNAMQGNVGTVTGQKDRKNLQENKDQKIDRLIRENIKKNKNRQNEESLKRQEADAQQKKRKEELSKLNQQVRQDNMSRIVNQQEKRALEGDYSSAMQPHGTMSGGNNSTKRRSQSAIEGINLSGGRKRSGDRKRNPSSEDKRIHHSQSNRAGAKSKVQVQDQQQTSAQQQKFLPHTTKAEFQGKPRSFVEEINQLTHQIEREIGRGNLKLDFSNQRQGNLTKKSPKQPTNDDSVNLHIKNSTVPTQQLTYQKAIEPQNEKKIRRQQKRHSLQVHRFMEKKKRQQQLKKSMELTIEVGKQLQVQKNLFKLENYVKRHNRNKSQPGVEKKPQVIPPSKIVQSKKVKRVRNLQNGIVDITNLKRDAWNQSKGEGFSSNINSEILHADNSSLNDTQNQGRFIAPLTTKTGEKQTVFIKHKSKSIGNVQPIQKTGGGHGRSETQRIQKSPEKQIIKFDVRSPPMPQNQSLLDQQDHEKMKKAYREQKKQQRKSAANKVLVFENEQGQIQDQQQLTQSNQKKNEGHSSIQSYTNVEIEQSRPQQLNIKKNDKKADPAIMKNQMLQGPYSQEQVSPKSAEQIRRIHELVALYRCRFKANASDAAVMGTLHSAASVIQIHFRYLKHLKENEQAKKKIDKKKDKKQQDKNVKNKDAQDRQPKKKENVSNGQKINKSGRYNSGLQVENQTSKEFANSSTQKQRKRSMTVNETNISQNSGRDNKTPHIPGLDFKKLNANQIEIDKQNKQQSKKPNDNFNEYVDNESPKAPLTASSYSSIFNKLGLPIPRSARIKVDFDLVKKDPTISAQLKEIIQFKEQKGAQILEENRKLFLITDRTYQKNYHRLEKWVNSSYNKVDQIQNQREPNSNKKRVKTKTEDQLINDTVDNRQRLVQKLNQLDAPSGKPSARLQSGRSKTSYRNGMPNGNEDDQNPYTNNHLTKSGYLNNNEKPIGSSRQEKSKIVEMINSSRTSNKKKEKSSDSQDNNNNNGVQNVQDIQIDFVDKNQNLDSQRLKNLMHFGDTREPFENVYNLEGFDANSQSLNNNGSSGKDMVIINQAQAKQLNDSQDNQDGSGEGEMSNQLNRSHSLNQIFKQENIKVDDLQLKDNLNEDSEKELKQVHSDRSEDKRSGNMNDIVDQLAELLNNDAKINDLSEAIENPKDKEPSEPSSTLKENNQKLVVSQASSMNNSEIRDSMPITQSSIMPAPQINNIRDAQYFVQQQKQDKSSKEQPVLEQPKKQSQHIHMQINSSSASMTNSQMNSYQPSNQTSPKRHSNLLSNSPASELDQQLQKQKQFQESSPSKLIKVENQKSLETNMLEVNTGPIQPHPVSPVSENLGPGDILTYAQSLSSDTDQDIQKVLNGPNLGTPQLESPPNILSDHGLPPLNVVDQSDPKQQENMQMADDLVNLITNQMLQDMLLDLQPLILRQNFARAPVMQVQHPSIKYFEKKGIKTDLFAIEKYVEEILVEVLDNREEFLAEIKRPLGKSPIDQLYEMQNDEIGNYNHFHLEQRPVLALNLYLSIEKRRKDSREHADESRPDGLFDFDDVTDQELARDEVGRNFLAEAAHIHNKVLFDCINDSLQQFRPHGKEGAPMDWSRQGRKLKPIEDFTIEEMFEITKHDLFRMAIMQAGTLPRKEFVFGGQFDDDLFSEIREKKLATLLVREIVETEPQWLKWDFEETQTKVDIADMVLESLMTETIDFLNQKNQQQQQNLNSNNQS